MDSVEQTPWVLFHKYLDDLEQNRGTATDFTGRAYSSIIDPENQGVVWAAPKLPIEKIAHNVLKGDDLSDVVN